MSRVGKRPVAIPKGVEVKVQGDNVKIKGPKGGLEKNMPKGIQVRLEGESVLVTRSGDLGSDRALHGTARAMIINMIKGVTEGFSKQLEIEGIGYKAQVQGGKLTLNLCYSHPVIYEAREGITIEVPDPRKITVSGADREAVGQVAAEIRRVLPPEPYKGKGIRYAGEYVRRKAGKTGAAQT
ncbi:MAG: 50S ribosomal protein L6 [bacterium]